MQAKSLKEGAEREEERARQMLRTASSGSEDRSVEVVRRRNMAEGVMEWVRTDTGQLVRSRPLTPEERQVTLFTPGSTRPEGAEA